MFTTVVKMEVKLKGKEKEVKLKEGSTVKDLLEALEINPETVLVEREKEIIPETEELKDGDQIHIINITSRG